MANEIVLRLPPVPGNGRNSEASFVTLKSGRILYVWSKFISDSHSDFGAAVLASRYSDDGGLTWSSRDRVVVRKDRAATNVMSPSLLRLRDGRIALLYLRKESGHVCMPWVRFSEDEAQTWSEPTCLTSVPGYYVVNNDRMIQTRKGRLIVPVALHRWRLPWEPKPMERLPGDTRTRYPQPVEPRFADPALILYLFSDDGGRAWFESENNYYRAFAGREGLQEPGVIELRDGRLWSWTRTGHIGEGARGSRQWQSFSDTAGLRWTEPEPSQFVSPCSPMSVKRIPQTGDLLAVWNDHSGRFKVPQFKPISWGRTPLVCAISSNEGRTWKKHKLLEKAPDQGFCYIAIHFVEGKPGAVLLSYNAGGAQSRMPLDTQWVRRITLDELYA